MVHAAIKQTWVASGVILNLMSLGLLFTYPYCLLPALRAPDSPIKVNLETASWLASSVLITSMIGMFISSYLMEVIGRRNAHALMMIPGIAGWIIVYYSTNITTLMIGRIVSGFWSGTVAVVGSTVVGEYTSPEYRGVFLGTKTAALCLGNLFMHIISHYYHWRTIALINVVPLVLTFCNICTWPKSPSWLAMKGMYEKSEKDFYWLRGTNEKSVREFEEMVRAQKERLKNFNKKESFAGNLKIFYKKFRRKDFVKPLLIIFVSGTLLEACGRYTFPTYAFDIMGKITGDSVMEKSTRFLYTIGIDIVTAVSATVSCVLTQFLKRRTLLFFSGISSLVFLVFICIYCSLYSYGFIIGRSWIPLSLLLIYYSLTNIGCTSVPIMLIGEIIPLPHRSTGMAVSGVLITIPILTLMKTTPFMLEMINISGTFAMYGLIMTFALIYLYFALPETRNRTLQEIEEYFNQGKYLDREIEMTKIGQVEEKQQMLSSIK